MLNALSFQDYLKGSDPGLWYEVYSGSQCLTGRPALFLDRDGVIVEDTQYLGRAQDVRMLAGAGEAIARCNKRGIPVILVSNQSGIARGLYDWSGFAAVQAAIASALSQAGARLDAVFACAHHVDGKAPLNIADHPWRKPNPGMIIAAAERMKLTLRIPGSPAIVLPILRQARRPGLPAGYSFRRARTTPNAPPRCDCAAKNLR